MSKCATCKYWSEMIAMVKHGTTVAMCLSDGPQSGKYTPKWGGCEKHDDGMPVDLDHVPAGQRQRSIDYRKTLAEDEKSS